MKKAIGILKNPDGTTPMTIYYNGDGEEMTAENEELTEELGYLPKSLKDAREAADIMYSGEWWDYEAFEYDENEEE